MPREAHQPGEMGGVRFSKIDGVVVAKCYLRRRDGVRVQVSRRGRNRRVAEQRLRDAVDQRVNETFKVGQRLSKTAPFRALCYAFANNQSGQRVWARVAEEELAWSSIGDVPLDRFTDATLDAFRSQLRASTEDTQLTMRVLYEVCRYGVAHGYWTSDRFDHYSADAKVKYEAGPVAVLTVPMVRDFIRAYALRPERRGPEPSTLISDILTVVEHTGAHLAEVLTWRWSDINALSGLYRTPGERFEKVSRILPDPLRKVLKKHTASKADGGLVFLSATGRALAPAEVRASLRAPLAWHGVDMSRLPDSLASKKPTTPSRAA